MSSRVSLLSSVTASSSGSSGSGSTVTQESISRPRNRTSKGKRSMATAGNTTVKPVPSPRKIRGGIDVFAFLDKDQSRASLVQRSPKKRPTDSQDEPRVSAHDDSDLESTARSFHSDSGISLNDTASDHESPKISEFGGQQIRPPQGDHGAAYHRPYFIEQRYHPTLQPIPHIADEDNPEWYYWQGSYHDEADVPEAPVSEAFSRDLEEPQRSGYDLLATSLSSSEDMAQGSIPPLYRRFGRLNHRILLQLQDEIAEMEEDLHHMDQADTCERTAQHGPPVPASRRLEWQWRGSELHARRLELLGRIYLKVEQYNQALASFMRVGSSTTPATIKDVESYRRWMDENKPVTDAEAAYLHKSDDLLSLTPRISERASGLTFSRPPTPLMMATTSATALPILLFRLLPSLTSRLLVILLLVPSIALIPKSQATMPLLDGRESGRFLSIYFGVLIFSALVL